MLGFGEKLRSEALTQAACPYSAGVDERLPRTFFRQYSDDISVSFIIVTTNQQLPAKISQVDNWRNHI